MAELLPEPYGTRPLTTSPVVVKDETATLKSYPDVYVAGSEPLAADEMRITALGTGYPSRRGQGCAGFMVELGNDEVFIFDAGAGTNSAFNHMAVPYHKANKFFITHYHIDHIGDLLIYYDHGQSNGRLEPMNVYGPTGELPELGIDALVENMMRMAAWHDRSKKGQLDPRGFEVVSHQFESPVLLDEGQVAALPGVTGRPVGDMVGVGQSGKATRFRWTETIDWGDGAPAARAVAGYLVMAEAYNPVYVVISWPAEDDRLAEAEALAATLVVSGDPDIALPPGATIPPSPTPFDKLASIPPAPSTPAPHAAPELEALLPDEVGGIVLGKSSWTGPDRGMTDADPLLASLGKVPADYLGADATPSEPPLFLMGVEQVSGVPGAQLLAARLQQMPDAKVTETTLSGKRVTYVEYGAWPVWYYPAGDRLFSVVGLPDRVAAALQLLP